MKLHTRREARASVTSVQGVAAWSFSFPSSFPQCKVKGKKKARSGVGAQQRRLMASTLHLYLESGKATEQHGKKKKKVNI